MFVKKISMISLALFAGANAAAAASYNVPNAAAYARRPVLVDARLAAGGGGNSATAAAEPAVEAEDQDWQAKELERAAADAVFQMTRARDACSGIAGGLEAVQQLLGVGAVLSGVGTVTGAAATGAGFWKAHDDEAATAENVKIQRLIDLQYNQSAAKDGEINALLKDLTKDGKPLVDGSNKPIAFTLDFAPATGYVTSDQFGRYSITEIERLMVGYEKANEEEKTKMNFFLQFLTKNKEKMTFEGDDWKTKYKESDQYALKQKTATNKNSQTLGVVRTAGAGVTTLTSVGAAITSGQGADGITVLVQKMDECNGETSKLQTASAILASAGADASDPVAQKISNAMASCQPLDSGNLDSIKKTLVANAWVSGAGALAGAVGAAASGVALYKEGHGQEATMFGKVEDTSKNIKGSNGLDLNMTANISSGVATAASLISTILGATSIGKLNADRDNAAACEAALM